MANPTTIEPAQRGLSLLYLAICVGVSLALVTVTGLLHLGVLSGAPLWLASRLNLGAENNLAAWWSGMLLLLLSLHAFDGYAGARQARPVIAHAWAIVAGLLLFLSLDEVGSLHERIGTFGQSTGIGGWTLILPLGAVLGILLARALITFWSDGPAGRRTAVLLAIGFALLGSVAIQEYLEHKLVWQEGLAKALRVCVEEGTELLGMLLLLHVLRKNTRPFGLGGIGTSRAPSFAAVSEYWPAVVTATALAAPFATVLSLAAHGDGRGLPGNWLAAVCFALSAAALARPALARGGLPSLGIMAMAGLCLAASLGAVLVWITGDLTVFGTVLSSRLVVLGTLGVILAVVGMARSMGRPGQTVSYALLGLFSAAIVFIQPTPWAVLVFSQALAIGTFAIIAHHGMRQHVPSMPRKEMSMALQL
jgi:hypothetical protein